MHPSFFIKNAPLVGKHAKGFTLIELIVTTVLVGIIGIFSSLFLYTGFNGYLIAKQTAEGALKAQIALDRISLELRDINNISALTVDTSVDYTSNTLPGARRVVYNSNTNTISIGVDGNDNALLDEVSNFTMTAAYVDLDNAGGDNEVAQIDVSFTLGDIGRPFRVQIYPRNMVPQPP